MVDTSTEFRQPLEDPEFADSPRLTAKRNPDETFCWFEGNVLSHATSTARIDVEAEWEEPVDHLHDDGPRRAKFKKHAFHLVLDEDESQVAIGRDRRTEEQAVHEARHELGDTKHRIIRYSPVGSVRSDKFPPETLDIREDISRSGAIRRVNIPSSSRPEEPKITGVVPIFRYEGRRLTKLRIFIDRPWYSSGDHELLGVVVRQTQENNASSELLNPFITQWESSTSSHPLDDPKPWQFIRKEVLVSEKLSLAELGDAGPRVSVVGHPVEYDMFLQQWFSDIDVDPGYSDFSCIRLALTRYQPHSLPGFELSRVATINCEF